MGKIFAILEAKLVVAMVLQKFEINLVNGHLIDSEVAITLRPKYGLFCNLKKIK